VTRSASAAPPPIAERARSGRAAVALLSASAIAIGASLILAWSAQAAVTHTFDSSFNIANPTPLHISVNQATGDVFVMTPQGGGPFGATTISKYDATGAPVNYSAIGHNELDGCCAFNGEPDADGGNVIQSGAFAIDNSPGLTKGYVFAAGGEVFKASGEYFGHIAGTSSDNPGQTGTACGLAIDPLGGVYFVHPQVGSAALPQDASFIDKFIPGSADRPEDWPPISTLYAGETESCNVAADSIGALYNSKTVTTERRPLLKYVPTLFDLLPDDPFSDSNCGCRGVTGRVIDPLVTKFAVDPSNDDVYADRRDEIARYDSDGNLIETFGQGDFTLGTGVGVNESSGKVYVADLETNSVLVYRAIVSPDITEVSASTGQKSATISASVGPDGLPSVTSCDIDYGADKTYGSTVPCTPGAPFSSDTDITANISGLTTETLYHYRVKAANANGMHFDVDHTFMTHAVAATTTEDPTNVTQNAASLNGSFVGNGEITSYHFEWGADQYYGNSTPSVPAGAAGGKQQATAALSGLDIYTPTSGVYHYRLVAENAVGTSYGEDLEFHTAPPNLPTVTGTSSSDISPAAATLNAQVNPGLGDTVVIFEYGTSSKYSEQTIGGDSIGGDNTDHEVSASVEDLTPGTTYHFRAVASNFTGTSYGEDRTFNTPDRPAVEGAPSSGVTNTGAILEARVTPNFSPTTYHFEYGPSGYGSATPESGTIGSDNVAHVVSTAVAGLAPMTTYHFRVVATNAVGLVNGLDQTFTTAGSGVGPLPVPPVRCRKNFVKRHGKCVKRKPKKHTARKRRQGNRAHG
jgi:hypothetical protein